jgi:hypothetical protein
VPCRSWARSELGDVLFSFHAGAEGLPERVHLRGGDVLCLLRLRLGLLLSLLFLLLAARPRRSGGAP